MSVSEAQPATAERCPHCASALVTARGAQPWCPACEWNLAVYEPARHQSLGGWARLDRRLTAFAHRLTGRQFRALSGASVSRPGWSLARTAVLLVSVLLYAVTVALLVVGGWLAVNDFPSLTLIPGVPLLVLGLALLPRFGRVDPLAVTVKRAEAPTLFQLIDQVAEAIGAPSPHTVVLERDFNAYATTVGVRRHRVLALGLPLWAVLPPQQRVALLGHELGHFVNGDPTRGLLTQPAFTTLAKLAEMTRPLPGSVARSSGIAEWLGSILAYALMAVVSSGFRAGQLMLLVVALRDRQRAEYLADELGAKAAGTDSAIGLADSMVSLDGIAFAVARAARGGGSADEWRVAAEESRSSHHRDLPALRQLSVRDETSLFATHPPSGLRARMVESRPQQTAAVVLSGADSAAIDAELTAHYAAARRDVAVLGG